MHTAGLAQVADRFMSDSYSSPTNDAPTHIALGTGSDALDAADTALQGTELDRNGMDATFPSRSGAVITYESTFTAGEATGTVEEAGLFNAAAAGTMTCRLLTGTVTVGASDEVVVTWTLTFSDA